MKLGISHFFRVVIATAHFLRVYHVWPGEYDGEKFLQILMSQAGFLGQNVSFCYCFDHVDDEDVAYHFQERCLAGLFTTEVDHALA